MSRYFWSTLSLIGLVVWLVGTYAPPGWLLPGDEGMGFPGSGRLLQIAAFGSFLLFVILQLWLLRATIAMRPAFSPSPTVTPAPPSIRLTLGAELFWTSLPLIMTLGLAWLSYQTWLRVPTV